MKKVYSFLVLFLIFNPVWVYTQGYGRHQGPPFHGPRFFFGYQFMEQSSVQLSKKQIDSITAINLKYKDKFISFHKKIEPIKESLRPLIAKEKKTSSDYKKIHSLLKKISVYEVELRYLKIKHRDEIFRVFTAEQKEIWRKNHRRGPHRHGKPPF